jgi:uncharacterized protein (TIGR03435 family)
MNKISLLIVLAITPAFAQQPKFEIADVHVSPTPFWFAQNVGGRLRDGLYINRDATVLQLIQAAYGVPEDGIGGGPSWLKSDIDIFDVVAKVPEGTTRETANLMVQSLLAERFGLVINKETHPTPRYVLSVGKGGSKLKRAAASQDSGCRPQQQTSPVDPTNRASFPNLKITCHNTTTEQLAVLLRQVSGSQYNTYLNYEVMDSTKLEGAWDFDLEFTPSMQVGDKGQDAITIFDAVNKQLGLKLELQEVPLPLWVIQKVNRNPTPNSPAVATDLVVAAPRFEVASVKAADANGPRMFGLRYTGGSQIQAAGTVRNLMALAYQIQPNAANDVLVGLPKSADTQFWSVTAKLPSTGEGAPTSTGGRAQAPPLRAALEMMRGMLADQFELKTHTENREVTVYALTLIDGKHKLIKADPNERSDCRPDTTAPRPSPSVSVMVNCKNTTMAEFARNLEQATGFFDHPIADATGLQGGWNFMIGWSSQRAAQVPSPNQAGGAAVDAADPGYLSSYDAVEKELGLKLVKQKRSIPVIVVDHVAEKPVE